MRRGQDRVVRFGTRLAISSDHVTILVRRLPSEQDKIERVRLYLSILVEGLDSRIHAMQREMLLDRRGQMLARVLQVTREKLSNIDDLRHQQRTRSGEITSALGAEVRKSLVKLDLTKLQETALIKIIETAADQIESVTDNDVKFEDQFQDIIDDLSGILGEQGYREGE